VPNGDAYALKRSQTTCGVIVNGDTLWSKAKASYCMSASVKALA
jgi:hypothetical protein